MLLNEDSPHTTHQESQTRPQKGQSQSPCVDESSDATHPVQQSPLLARRGLRRASLSLTVLDPDTNDTGSVRCTDVLASVPDPCNTVPSDPDQSLSDCGCESESIEISESSDVLITTPLAVFPLPPSFDQSEASPGMASTRTPLDGGGLRPGCVHSPRCALSGLSRGSLPSPVPLSSPTSPFGPREGTFGSIPTAAPESPRSHTNDDHGLAALCQDLEERSAKSNVWDEIVESSQDAELMRRILSHGPSGSPRRGGSKRNTSSVSSGGHPHTKGRGVSEGRSVPESQGSVHGHSLNRLSGADGASSVVDSVSESTSGDVSHFSLHPSLPLPLPLPLSGMSPGVCDTEDRTPALPCSPHVQAVRTVMERLAREKSRRATLLSRVYGRVASRTSDPAGVSLDTDGGAGEREWDQWQWEAWEDRRRQDEVRSATQLHRSTLSRLLYGAPIPHNRKNIGWSGTLTERNNTVVCLCLLPSCIPAVLALEADEDMLVKYRMMSVLLALFGLCAVLMYSLFMSFGTNLPAPGKECATYLFATWDFSIPRQASV
ncbi:hypothetical protein KIPB_006914, partial [Kipferlia bialata]|eukprot:g6914.t1